MPRYRLDDPRLEEVIAEMAARDVATWPRLTEAERAKIAPILAPPESEAPVARRRRRRTSAESAPEGRAA